MATELSLFESSKILASSPSWNLFLENSWTLCNYANSAAPRSFVAAQQEGVGYLAFSGVQVIDRSEPSCGTLTALGEFGCESLFWPLRCDGDGDGDGEGTVKVDAGFLRLFLEFYRRQDFQKQIEEFRGKVKMIILTGHSFGATTASLTALWLLSQLQLIAYPISVHCLTFGTPLLGNESLSRAILQERWGGSFCNVVSKLDVVPKLFFTPLTSWTPQLHLLLQFWGVAMDSPNLARLVRKLRKQKCDEFFSNVKKSVKDAARSKEGARKNLFWPLGSYLFCSEEGVICLDNAASVVKMMHLMLETVSPDHSFEDHLICFEDHLKYGYYTGQRSLQLPKMIDINNPSKSSYEADVFLALRSSGIDPKDDHISKPAKDCRQMACPSGCAPKLSAHLAIRPYMIIPFMVQLEDYKAHCYKSMDKPNKLGYYDTFKNAGASRREFMIDMILFTLGAFWDNVIQVVKQNKLLRYFHHGSKWNNLSHLYRLLAEPLEIARYYGMHKEKRHYIGHGRNLRFKILERWNQKAAEAKILERWNRKAAEVQEPQQNNNRRRRGARFTRDSLFWAKVERAKEWLEIAEKEEDPSKLKLFLEKLNRFEKRAQKLIVRKGVSIDVLANKSSYILWAKKWEASKSKLHHRSKAFNSHELLAEPSEITRGHRHGMDKDHNFHRNLEDHLNINGLSESSNEAGDCLALQSSGVDPQNQTKEILEGIEGPLATIEAGKCKTSQSPPMPNKAGEGEVDIQSLMSVMKTGKGSTLPMPPKIPKDYTEGSTLPMTPKIPKDYTVVHIPTQTTAMSTETEEPTETPGESVAVGILTETGAEARAETGAETGAEARAETGAEARAETGESSRESNSEAMLLALNAASLGCVSTAFFGVNQNIYLDWLGMAYIISLALAVFLVMFGKCSHHKEMITLGNHFTRATIVLTVAIVIAAAVLGKRKR